MRLHLLRKCLVGPVQNLEGKNYCTSKLCMYVYLYVSLKCYPSNIFRFALLGSIVVQKFGIQQIIVSQFLCGLTI